MPEKHLSCSCVWPTLSQPSLYQVPVRLYSLYSIEHPVVCRSSNSVNTTGILHPESEYLILYYQGEVRGTQITWTSYFLVQNLNLISKMSFETLDQDVREPITLYIAPHILAVCSILSIPENRFVKARMYGNRTIPRQNDIATHMI